MRQLGLQQLLYILCCMSLIGVSSSVAQCILLSKLLGSQVRQVLLDSVAHLAMWLAHTLHL